MIGGLWRMAGRRQVGRAGCGKRKGINTRWLSRIYSETFILGLFELCGLELRTVFYEILFGIGFPYLVLFLLTIQIYRNDDIFGWQRGICAAVLIKRIYGFVNSSQIRRMECFEVILAGGLEYSRNLIIFVIELKAIQINWNLNMLVICLHQNCKHWFILNMYNESNKYPTSIGLILHRTALHINFSSIVPHSSMLNWLDYNNPSSNSVVFHPVVHAIKLTRTILNLQHN